MSVSTFLNLVVALVSFLPLSAVAQFSSGCILTSPQLTRNALYECFPSFQAEISDLFRDDLINAPSTNVATMPDLTTSMCRNLSATVNGTVCFQEKWMSCIPREFRYDVAMLVPDMARWARAINMTCSDINTLQVDCLDNVSGMRFQACLENRMEDLILNSDFENADSIRETVCGVSGAVETCIKRHHGSCSDNYVNTVTEVLNVLMPCNGAIQSGATVILSVIALFLTVIGRTQ